MPIAKLARTLLLPLILLAAVLAPAAPAGAVEVGCSGTVYDSTRGAYICVVAGADSVPGSSSIRISGGSPGCFYNGREIPCTLTQGIARWDTSRQCYFEERDADSPSLIDDDTFDNGSDGVQELTPVQGERTETSRLFVCSRLGGGLFSAGEFMTSFFWSESPPPPPVLVNPADVWAAALDSMGLTAISQQIAPPPVSVNSDSVGLVGLGNWFWAEPTPTTWGPQTASATAMGVTVTGTVGAVEVEWDTGDGHTVTCYLVDGDPPSVGTRYDASYGVETPSPDCGHTYDQRSPDQVRDPETGSGSGSPYLVTATTFWTGTWSGGGQSGTAELEFEASEQLRIGEAQAIRTD